MHITRVKIANILGIADLDFEAGAFTEIEGPNGAGKTSVLEAIKSVARGGEDATLLRKGADKGEIVLVLDDGTELRKRLTPRGSTTLVQEPGGARSAAPAGAIKALVDMLSLNPVDFLRYGATAEGKKKRLAAMLECLPIAADPARLTEIAGAAARLADPDLPALDQIDAIYKAVFDDRTMTNRAVREKEGAISQLRAALPPQSTDGPSGDIVALELDLAAVDAARAARFSEIDAKLDGLREESYAKIEAWRTTISDLQAKISGEQTAFADWRAKAATQREIDAGKFAARREPLTAAIAAVRNDRAAAWRAKAARESIQSLVNDSLKLQQDAAGQTTVLDALQAYKLDLLASLPIPGLEVRDGEIFSGGVPYDRLNSQQQVEIAVEIAKLRAGELGVICVDGLELLDREHFEAFRDRAVESGLQLFVTRVTDGEFQVRAHH